MMCKHLFYRIILFSRDVILARITNSYIHRGIPVMSNTCKIKKAIVQSLSSPNIVTD